MTFEEWRATLRWNYKLRHDQAGEYEGQAGWSYDGGFIVRTDDGFRVPLCSDEHDFETLEEAERFLWDAWIDPEH